MGNEHYGLKPMTFQEEVSAPDTISETRMCKIAIIDNCHTLIRKATSIIEYAKRIPEEDDTAHMELVQSYAEGINSTLITLIVNEQKRWTEFLTERKG